MCRQLWCALTFCLWFTAIEVICVIAYVYGLFDANSVYALLCLYDIRQITDSAQIWRLLTPIFVHFSILHIAFNLVMFEAFARGIENKIGTVKIYPWLYPQDLYQMPCSFYCKTMKQDPFWWTLWRGLCGYWLYGYALTPQGSTR
ncbi:rhomboid family intramembrane serine protease [Anaerobiospirillum thomasii]|uniref:rhomboid family intramembrane serine protease n=1 Tax=Anaerobiospirillum thomasii TaxID=179995 RepID=UPI000DE583EB